MKGWDHSLRACGLCGASGRVDSQGRTQVVWEPDGEPMPVDERENIRRLLGQLRSLEHEYQQGPLHPNDYLERRREIVRELCSLLA